VQSITAFALYGFPESHAASFALIAYASAWLKCHYPAAFTAALLNNQPMGFYSPSTLVKDAQRHGVRVLPVDITLSEWLCTIEANCLRLGLCYVRGLHKESGEAIVAERARRPFASIGEMARRLPELRKDELRKLAAVGALNPLERTHRRDALWESERAARPSGPLFGLEQAGIEFEQTGSVLVPMDAAERLGADYQGLGLTVGRHPMAHRRKELDTLGVRCAAELMAIPDGRPVRVAGCVIVRQRPGTAKGFVFLSLEDETGISNIIVEPQTFDRNRVALTTEPFLLIEGILQNQDRTVSVKAGRVQALHRSPGPVSHDFH
jgi:error-prone DNA polymerase